MQILQVGTLEYMAPEVLQKQPTTAASDVYAWAVTVNEIATGIFPFADCTKDNPQCQTVLNFGFGRSACSFHYSLAAGPLAKYSHPAHDLGSRELL
jgi:serine/threonine protein kinase